jgi:Na+-transporting NADH:ubiquinone oxidoreductase subunit C
VSPISLAYLLTKPLVDLNEQVFLRKAVLYAAGIPVPKTGQEVASTFDARARVVPGGDGGADYYSILDESGSPSGWVLLRSGPGLWGEITAAVGFDITAERLTGVEFLKQGETPGLGARISEVWFREQFRGKRGPFTTVPEGEPSEEDEFDAITGATLTTNFVRDILNSAVEQVPGLVD